MGMLSVTIQSVIMSATSNIIAQAITAYRTDSPFVIDWVPVLQFFIFTLIATPPNYMWQDFLESTFPANAPSSSSSSSSPSAARPKKPAGLIHPTTAAVMAASEHDAATSEKHLDELARQGKLATTAPSESEEPKLNIRNTAVKTLLDQTVGATANTLLFLAFMTALQSAITRGAGAGATLSVDWSRVDWRTDITARCRRDFWPVMLAGWKFWPFISLVNFAFVKSVEARNLLGGVAGMVWGVYISLFAAGQD